MCVDRFRKRTQRDWASGDGRRDAIGGLRGWPSPAQTLDLNREHFFSWLRISCVTPLSKTLEGYKASNPDTFLLHTHQHASHSTDVERGALRHLGLHFAGEKKKPSKL